MIVGDVPFRPTPSPMLSAARRRAVAVWQRRTIEAMVAVLAFAVWGQLAYRGGARLLLRMEDVPIGGSVLLDVASLGIGVSGSIAGVVALWALAMRVLGRSPASVFGAPDDTPADIAYREAWEAREAGRTPSDAVAPHMTAPHTRTPTAGAAAVPPRGGASSRRPRWRS